MWFFPVLLSGLIGCGPDPELLERVVQLENEMEQVQSQLVERTAAPAKCAQTKKAALDAWKGVWKMAEAQVRKSRRRENKFSEVDWSSDDRKTLLQDWEARRSAAAGARRAANGGANKAKAAADHAATFHVAGDFDTTAAMDASTESWEACKIVDP